MEKLKIYNTEGKKTGEVKLEPKVFNIKVKPVVVQQAVRTQLANKRVAIAHTKTRPEVRGGGRKPWRQKGTGRARHGSIRSPIWVGGGVTFGPRHDRNYSLKMNKKARRQALFMVLSNKAEEKRIVAIDKLELPEIKTKSFVKIISKLPLKKTVLVILPKSNPKVVKSARNLPDIKITNANSLNVVDVLASEYLLLTKESLAIINKTYLK